MVSGVKFKRSKAKNFISNDSSYPRDIWEFVAKSTERVYNTSTGALLKDVLNYQALTPREAAQFEKEFQFPKTVFPKIDPARLKPRAVSVDPDVERGKRIRLAHVCLIHHNAGSIKEGATTACVLGWTWAKGRPTSRNEGTHEGSF